MNAPVIIGNATLYLGDCREVLPTLPKVDAVVADPPYSKVRGDFDNEWTNRPAMLKDAAVWLDAMIHVMKPNATLWWFAWPSLAGRIEAMIAERLNPLAHIVWEKPAPQGQKCRKESLRAPMPLTERLLMAEHYGADNWALGESGYQAKCNEAARDTFGKYITATRAKHALTKKALTEAVGAYGAVNHGGACSNWENGNNVPTRDHYKKLQATFPGCFDREYEDLRREYEDLRRWFDCRAGDQFSDIWRFPPCRERTGHPTPKPLQMMEYIVRLSVRPGGSVVDPFAGGGTTGVACANLGRKFIGIERDRKYFDIACERIARAYDQARLTLGDAM